ncbi:MAG TPA: Uma2 family endonuclease [Blastocatellia bacterium]|nr:Uma2 family endonuclease [Blastocatellia bacterium]
MAQEIKKRFEVAGAAPPPRMTYEEFLDWADEDTYAEWVDGEVILLSPATDRHQDLVDFLTALFRHFTEAHQSGVVRSAPFQMKTGPDLPGREPDIVFVASEHRDRLQKTHLRGPADLVVEIVSPESRTRDRKKKFAEYEQGGVREYWVIDYLRKEALFYLPDEDGSYHAAPVGEDGIFRSHTLEGLWLRVDWLWQEPLPPLMDVLRQWGLV